MTDQEKIERYDTLVEIRNSIAACFGSENGVFASHPLDKERAEILRELVNEKEVPLIEVREIALGHLHGKKYPGERISEEIERFTEFLNEKTE